MSSSKYEKISLLPDPATLRASVLPLFIALFGLLIVRDFSTWVTFTIAGLGMGMILFMVSSGLTLVFGLMGVMNFGHGVFMMVGAFAGVLAFHPRFFLVFYSWFWADNIVVNVLGLFFAGMLGMLANGYASNSLIPNILAVLVGLILVALTAVPFAWIFERLFIRPAGRVTLMQIILTTTGMILFGQLFIGLVGNGVFLHPPSGFRGSWLLGEVSIEKMRVFMIVLGLLVWGGLMLLLHYTRLGILVRATVENREMVEASGYRTRRLMTAMFMLGAGLAAMGGLVWGMFQMTVSVNLGSDLLPLMFMVLMIGGLGSVGGTMLASIMVGLVTNYFGYVFPDLAAFSSIFLMMCVVFWRPDGLFPLRRA